ncbi:MAG TPA: 2Fe-2S iron-sulfur cluster-binding protein, partial [Peptostreptococcaceae bacterium]|nr:2Fe-2S iron-sulfur cluster-binding protein [Peptostreptococcaceae bacterium]
GLSQVTIVKTIKQLLKNNNHVEVFIDNYKKPIEDVIKLVELMGVNIQFIDFEKDSYMVEDYIRRNNVKLVFSASFNNFNKRIMEIVDEVDEDIRLVITNNNLISCGEGICGACTVKVNGQRLKSCKAQIEPRYFLREVVK